MNALLDAIDSLNRARCLNRMFMLAAEGPVDDDDRARAALSEAIEDRFEEAFALLDKAKEEAGPGHAPGLSAASSNGASIAAE